MATDNTSDVYTDLQKFYTDFFIGCMNASQLNQYKGSWLFEMQIILETALDWEYEESPIKPKHKKHRHKLNDNDKPLTLEGLMKKGFEDGMISLKQKYPYIKNTMKREALTLFHNIYCHSHDLDYRLLPIRIDYFMLSPEMNKQFKCMSHAQCDHNQYQYSMYSFVSKIVSFIRNNIEYNPKLTNQTNRFPKLSNCIPCALGCCMQCASLLTRKIVGCCYKLSKHKGQYVSRRVRKYYKDISPGNIDMLCILNVWLANILQYKYVKTYLSKQKDLMPHIFLTLYRLMITAHILYKDNKLLYFNKRRIIYFAIWKSAKEIVLNHCYVKKYYQNKDVKKERLCEHYVLYMVKWTMDELTILSQIDINKNDNVLKSLNYDYFGGIIILMSLLEKVSDETLCSTSKEYISHEHELVSVWMNIHAISHETTYIGKYFEHSIKVANRLRNKHRIKCQWKSCRYWNRCNKFYKCKKCKTTSYCSRKCQKKDWVFGFHRLVCK
eukprot:24200_1